MDIINLIFGPMRGEFWRGESSIEKRLLKFFLKKTKQEREHGDIPRIGTNTDINA